MKNEKRKEIITDILRLRIKIMDAVLDRLPDKTAGDIREVRRDILEAVSIACNEALTKEEYLAEDNQGLKPVNIE